MTYEEASNGIKTWLGYMRKSNEGNDFANEFIDCAEFMTKSVVREALEKQMPKKPEIDIWEKTICPNCGEWVGWDYKSKYCCDCGQALDWSDEE